MSKKLALTALLALTVMGLTFGASAFQGVPGEHEKFMKDEYYAQAYESFEAVMKEAGERLDEEEFARLEKENAGAIENFVKEDMASGDTTPEDAYGTAYWMRAEHVNKELVWDWLRKNAVGVTGFYRLEGSTEFDGYMTVQEADEEGEYAVYVFLAMKEDPENSTELEGLGKLEGNAMTVEDMRNEDVSVSITFDGEIAKIVSPEEVKKAAADEEAPVLDGRYHRETKALK